MKLRIDIRSGARAGHSLTVSESPATLGRDPECSVVFDAHADLEVSARHAAFFADDTGWLVRDLGSRNGTYVDGRRVEGLTRLTQSCAVRLGADGPELHVTVVGQTATPEGGGRHEASHPSARGAPPVPQTLVSRLLRERQTLQLVIALLAASVLTVLAVLLVRGARERADWARERAALLTRIDSVLVASDVQVRALAGYTGELADTLRSSREQIERLQAEISRRPADGPRATEELERRLQAAAAEVSRLQLAASIDWPAIEGRIIPGVARVFVESADGGIEAGTAFLVRDDGTFVTAGHLVAGRDGQRRTRRIAVQLSATTALRDARAIAVSVDDDLALIRTGRFESGQGGVAFNPRPDTIPGGQPVALVGFPLGGGPGEGGALPVRSAGILRVASASRIEIEGISERGGSGSPVMDARGAVIGLLRGAVERDGKRVLVAVPSPTILALLNR